MKKKPLDYLTESDEKLRRAEEAFLGTFDYDNGLSVRRHSGKYYDAGGTMTAISSFASPITSIIDQARNTAYKDLTTQREYNNRSALEGISDNDALLAAYDNLDWGDTKKGKDFRNGTAFGDVTNSLMGGLSAGLATGNIYVGIGAAAAGLGANAYKWAKAGSDARKWNNGLSDYRSELSRRFGQTADKVDTMNDRRLLEAFYNSAAFGGDLNTHGADWDNGLTFINAGGSHESNPNDGVPAGVDENGTPNLVEEGEVIWNNEYVFSKRLKVPKKLRDKYKLNEPISYADAVKKLTKESEERKNDPISNDTTKAIVNDFIDSQEEVRAKKQQRAAERLQQAQYENELLNAIAGLGANQSPVAPVDMRAPIQEVPQEAPVIEQMGAYGGNLFAGGGDLRKRNGQWIVVLPDGTELPFATKERAQEYYNRTYGISSNSASGEQTNSESWLDRMRTPQRDVVSTTVGENPDFYNNRRERVERRADRRYTEGSEAYNRFLDKKNAKISAQEGASQRARRQREEEAANTATAVELEGLGRRAATEYLNSLGFKKYEPNQMKDTEKEIYSALLTGQYKDKGDYLSRKEINTSTGASVGGTTPINEEVLSSAENMFEPFELTGATITTERPTPPPPPSSGGQGKGSGFQGSNPSAFKSSLSAKEMEETKGYREFLQYIQSNPEAQQTVIDGINARDDVKKKVTGYDDLYNRAMDGAMGDIHRAVYEASQNWYKEQTTPTPVERRSVEPLPTKVNALDDVLAEYNSSLAGRTKAQGPIPHSEWENPNINKGNTNGYDWRREAPIIGGLAQSLFGLFGEPDYTEANQIISEARKLGTPVNIPVQLIPDKVKRRPYDERYMVNLANQNKLAAERNAANTAGGNRAMQLGMNAFLAHSNQAELGEIMRQQYLANRQDEFTTAEFNRGSGIQNANAINSRNLAQAQLNSQRQQAGFSGLANGLGTKLQQRTAWDATTGQNLSNLFNNLSVRGKEAITDNMVQSMYENGYYPHKMNPDGTIEFAPIEGRVVLKCGGKKKRRF